MSGRTYLSIGDVLTLLRREFPDVTISKIRFLESQGLVDPERTPSGYRKFYEHDVERLRWVLRQQREHFLPLKVIKGRLEEETSSPSPRQPNGRGVGDRAEIRSEQSSAVLVGKHSAGRAAPSEEGVGASVITGVPAHRPLARSEGVGRSELPGVGVQSAFPEPSPTVPTGETSPAPSRAESGLHLAKPPVTSAGTDRAAARTDAAQRRLGRVERAEPPTAEATSPASAAPPVSDVTSMAAFAGTSVTADELAAESGLEASAVRDLESFGLLSGRSMGGEVYYDEDALLIAKLAAAFAQYGVEARHLRLHLLAAQREAGFVEQIVLPLLKQRNPASRQRAHETVDELTRLGQEIRAVLLQRSLRELLGG